MENDRLALKGATYRYSTSTGTAFITLNRCGAAQDLIEVFCNVGKAGSSVYDFSEAIGRLVSLALQMPDNLPADERAKLVIKQLRDIGGDRQSVPDAVAKALEIELEEDNGRQTVAD